MGTPTPACRRQSALTLGLISGGIAQAEKPRASRAHLGLLGLLAALWVTPAGAEDASGVPMPDLKCLSREERSNLEAAIVSKAARWSFRAMRWSS
jgi:hypothetical protein